MIVLHESRHLREAGFFRFLFTAVRDCGDDVQIKEARPVEIWKDARGLHDGAWIDWHGTRLFFDMSDHVFQFDLNAWRKADLYFKANLNRSIAREVLETAGEIFDDKRLQAFCFFPPSLGSCEKFRTFSALWPFPGPSVCHIVGVYENPYLQNRTVVAPKAGELLAPNEMHFWIRRTFSEILRESFPNAFSRLTSRGNRKIEDRRVVFPNLSHQRFLWKLLVSRFTLLNTYPHAVYPWKAFESLALGVPFLVESEPLIEIPEDFRPVAGEHFLEILPGAARFREGFNSGDPATYRTVRFPGVEAIREGMERVVHQVSDSKEAKRMKKCARSFARSRLSPSYLFTWLEQKVDS